MKELPEFCKGLRYHQLGLMSVFTLTNCRINLSDDVRDLLGLSEGVGRDSGSDSGF